MYRAGSVPDAHEADILDEPQPVRRQETGRRLAGAVLQARRPVHRLPAGELLASVTPHYSPVSL